MKHLIVVALLCAALGLPAVAGELVAPAGYSLSEIVFSDYVSGFDIAPNGNFIVLHGDRLDEVAPDGTMTNLYQYSPVEYTSSVYGSFVKVDSSTGRVYFGETTKGWIKSIGLDGSNPANLVRAPGNYDLEIAAGSGFLVAGSDIYQLNLTNGAVDAIVTGASPWSGPVTVDGNGNLYYGTNGTYSGDSEWILSWTAAQVSSAVGSTSLSAADGQKLVSSLPGVSGFAWSGPDLFFTSNVWGSSYKLTRYSGGSATEFATGNSWLSVVRVNQSTGAISVNTGITISTLTPVPEPASVFALAVGIGTFFVRRRK